MHKHTKTLPFSALFIALGIAYPFFFHWMGLGKIFLPMFWPMAAAGFFLPLPVCVAVGILTPVLSFLISGMPPPPILYIMIAELALLTVSVHIIHHKLHTGNFWTIFFALFVSRCTTLLMAWIVAPLLALPPRFYAIQQLIEGLPGIISMLVVVPFFVSKLTKTSLFHQQGPHA